MISKMQSKGNRWLDVSEALYNVAQCCIPCRSELQLHHINQSVILFVLCLCLVSCYVSKCLYLSILLLVSLNRCMATEGDGKLQKLYERNTSICWKSSNFHSILRSSIDWSRSNKPYWSKCCHSLSVCKYSRSIWWTLCIYGCKVKSLKKLHSLDN